MVEKHEVKEGNRGIRFENCKMVGQKRGGGGKYQRREEEGQNKARGGTTSGLIDGEGNSEFKAGGGGVLGN